MQQENRNDLIYYTDSKTVHVSSQGSSLNVSLSCPTFIFGEGAVQKDLVSLLREEKTSRNLIKVKYAVAQPHGEGRLEIELYVEWFPEEQVLRKWARYKADRQFAGRVLREVVLERIQNASEQLIHFQNEQMEGHQGQSHPCFFRGYYAGIEFPTASTRLEEGELLLAYRPGITLVPETWYETRKAVFGTAPADQEIQAFQNYLSSHSVTTEQLHINYNSWYTSPVPYSENDILAIMQQFKEHLFDPYGVSFDTFGIDLGWSDPHSIWEINKDKFPEDFSKLEKFAAGMNSNLGLWISPSSCYGEALDHNWAKEQGYQAAEVPWVGGHLLKILCLGDPSYRERLKERLVTVVRNHRIRHIKFDGCILGCPGEDHVHEPGLHAADTIAQGIIEVFQAIRNESTDVWLEATCFGWNPSPWWLFHVNSALGIYGDDIPFGRGPSPVYRESHTTARDYFNLQGAGRVVIPPRSQEVLGIAHQTDDPLTNDLVMTIMRGHFFLPIYMNPNYMNETRWKTFAGLINWARSNASTLKHTETLLPVSWQNVDGDFPKFTNDGTMPREPYGYAHWAVGKGLVALRNPWIAPGSYRIKIPDWSGRVPNDTTVDVVSLYPEARVYARNVQPGDTVQVELAPYETVVLSIGSDLTTAGKPEAKEAIKPCIAAEVSKANLIAGELLLNASLDISAPRAELVIILEGNGQLSMPKCHIQCGGEAAEVIAESSDNGWAHSWIEKKEDWIILKSAISSDSGTIECKVSFDRTITRISAWIWSSKEGNAGNVNYPNAMPQPETITLDAIALLNPSAIPGNE